jgi:hypothetical protein
MATILLVGPGAIGTTLSAWPDQDDRHHLEAATRTPFDLRSSRTAASRWRASKAISIALASGL